MCEIDDTLPAGDDVLEGVVACEKGESDYKLREGEMTIAEELEKEDPVSQSRSRVPRPRLTKELCPACSALAKTAEKTKKEGPHQIGLERSFVVFENTSRNIFWYL